MDRDALIAAADKYAEFYGDDKRECIITDVRNAFFMGAQAAQNFAAKHAQEAEPSAVEKFWRVKIRYTDEKGKRQEIVVVASEPQAASITESGEVASQRAVEFAHSLNPFGSRTNEYEVVSASTTKLPLQLADKATA